MKTVYEMPAVEIIYFTVENVITASGGDGEWSDPGEED